MAKQTKAIKQGNKATNIKRTALTTFTKASESVKKANLLLDKAIDLSENELQTVEQEVKDLYIKLDIVQARKISLMEEKVANKLLITRLNNFGI